MRILITGSSGLLGTALKQSLQAAHIEYDVVERTTAASDAKEQTSSTASGSQAYRVEWPSGLSAIPYERYSTVVHLALARPNPKDPIDRAIQDHVTPLQSIVEGIHRAGAECSLLFVSSQSSSPEAISGYGRGKWACEQILHNSQIRWTILRPGLIVGNSQKGLFGAILNLIKISPVVPVPVGAAMQVQPVLLDDVVAACMKVIAQPAQHSRSSYDLALPPRSLASFTRELCRQLRLHRIVIPIPWRLISGLLRVTECLPIHLPASRSNLEGLLASRQMQSEESTAALGMTLRNCSEAIVNSPADSPQSREARYLFTTIFRSEAPSEVITRYNAAQRNELLNGTWINIDAIIERHLDAEAIEFASRRLKTILSQKMHIMCYVAESSSSLMSEFINSRSCRTRAFAELGIAGVRSAWKLVYGTYLIKRFNLLDKDSHD